MPVPSDFDMRRPSAACTVEWMTTSENGPRQELEPIIIIRATHRLMISRAVRATCRVERAQVRGVSSGQPSVANGQSADENQVSSTSGSRSSCSMPQSGSASARSPATIVVADSQYHTGSWWPHQSWRETHHGRMASIQPKKMRSAPFGWKRTLPVAHGGDGRRGELLHAAEPLQRDERLDAGAERSQWPTECTVRLLLAQQAALAQVLDHLLLGLGHRQTRVALARLVGHVPVEADHGDLGEAVAAPDLEVVRVVARGDLERAGAEGEVDVVVGHDRHVALGQRHDRALADQGR